jgi:hypothetical protein
MPLLNIQNNYIIIIYNDWCICLVVEKKLKAAQELSENFEVCTVSINHVIKSTCLMPLSAIFELYHGDQFLVVEEAGVPGENHRPWESNW